ncbi:unnamed protein product, partial [Leptidea sinapis]
MEVKDKLLNIWKAATIPKLFYFTITLGYACFFYVYVVSMLWCVFVYYRQNGDFVAASIILSLGAFTETCPIKDLIQDVLERYLSCDAQIIEGTRLASNVRNQLKMVKKRAITIWLTLMIIPLIHCIGPFFRPGRHFPEDKYILY